MSVHNFDSVTEFARAVHRPFEADVAWQAASKDTNATLDYLAAVPLVPAAEARGSLRESVVGLLGEKAPTNVRKAAITALASMRT